MFSNMQSMVFANAKISGNTMYPNISGEVYFYEVYGGTMVVASVKNLPNGNGFHGFHIHTGSSCKPMSEGGHYNPNNQMHPQHVGDMPPLLANDGIAISAFYTNRFYPEDVVGKVVVIHANPDDFTSQPSGNPGSIIACGEIKMSHFGE